MGSGYSDTRTDSYLIYRLSVSPGLHFKYKITVILIPVHAKCR